MAVGILDTKNHWMVGTSHIYVPQGFKVEHTNVASADSGRTEDGVMHITWVRRDIRKCYFTFNVLTGNEWSYMLNLMQGKEFTLTYYDNGVKTMNGYCGECNYEVYAETIREDEGGLYRNISINVEEI